MGGIAFLEAPTVIYEPWQRHHLCTVL